jgi:hypothetical protein
MRVGSENSEALNRCLWKPTQECAINFLTTAGTCAEAKKIAEESAYRKGALTPELLPAVVFFIVPIGDWEKNPRL